MKCIIPAAGYGTRMSMKPNQSKEMIKDKDYHNHHMIQWALDLCSLLKIKPLVLTREDKKDLRQYLFNAGIEFIDVKPEGEWYDTVLQSKEHWDEDNLLLLPDTRFHKIQVIEDIQRGLELGNNAVFALHEVIDPSKWGIVIGYHLLEKPEQLSGKQWAWGLIGFKDYYGQKLFSHLKSNLILEDVGFTYLNKFEDITRSK